MKRKGILSLFALSLATGLLTGCSGKDETVDKAPPPGPDAKPAVVSGNKQLLGPRKGAGVGKPVGQ